MSTTVDDVQHGHRQDVRVHATDVLRQLKIALHRRGLGDGQGHREQRVGPETALVGGSVEVNHGLVNIALVGGL